jgi:dephospho-CoA kinase
LIIGLTGGIACGKSAVAQHLEALGAGVIDADQVSQDLYRPGSFLFSRIIEAFGSELVNSDGTLDRKALGQIVFANREKRELLESLVHPSIWGEIQSRLRTSLGSHKVVVLMVPLLLENNRQSIVDEVWVVDIDPETQISRLQKRNQLTREESLQRISAQMSREERLKRADVVIDNSRDFSATIAQIDLLWSQRGC